MNNEQLSDILDDLKFNIANAYNISDNLQSEFLSLIKSQPHTFYGRSEQKHITCSVLVVDNTFENVLLTHHKKFNQWLALGGHWMDSPGVIETAFEGGLREVFEEAYGNNAVNFNSVNHNLPLNLDIHNAGKDIHYDMCFTAQIDKNIPYIVSDESLDLEWTSIEKIIHTPEVYNPRLIQMCNDLLTLKPQNKAKPSF